MTRLVRNILGMLFIASGQLRGECRHVCDKPLVSSKSLSGRGLVACGYLEGRHGSRTRASEFAVYRCSDSRKLLEFGALQTADLLATAKGIVVVEVSRWPFGRHWQEKYVSIRETILDGSDTVTWKPRLRRARVSRAAVKRFLRDYTTQLRRRGRLFTPDEAIVAKLFAAAMTGDPTAQRLFGTMRQDVSLDGAAAEIYEMALADQRNGTEPSSATIALHSSKP